jgi:hypothetical protein
MGSIDSDDACFKCSGDESPIDLAKREILNNDPPKILNHELYMKEERYL